MAISNASCTGSLIVQVKPARSPPAHAEGLKDLAVEFHPELVSHKAVAPDVGACRHTKGGALLLLLELQADLIPEVHIGQAGLQVGRDIRRARETVGAD